MATLFRLGMTIFFFRSYAFMPDLGKNGERVLYCKVKNSDPSKFVFAEALKAFLNVEEIFAYEMVSPSLSFPFME